MKDIKFSVITLMRTYSLEFRPQDYPTFKGLYNVYIAVYGLLSGEYLGSISEPLKIGFKPGDNTSELIESANKLIESGYKIEIW